jgi:hypothetical protein
MTDLNLQNQYLAHSITQIPRVDAQEILILSRRLQYITAKYSDDSEYDDLVVNLADVNTTAEVIKQLQQIQKSSK